MEPFIQDLMDSRGIKALHPPQQQVVDKGYVTSNKNLVVAATTSSGKTFIGEMCMLNALRQGKKALYLTPLKALATEKYDYFKENEGWKYTTTIRTGDYSSEETDLKGFDIIVLTYEKLDSLMRRKPDWVADVGTVIVDEGHQITDRERGATLEVLITRIKAFYNAKIVILSAVLGNVNAIADWLEADLIETDWRPVPLRIGLYPSPRGDSIVFSNNTERKVEKKDMGDLQEVDGYIVRLVMDIIKEGGQALVFAKSRARTEWLAHVISQEVGKSLDGESRRALLNLSNALAPTIPENTERSRATTAVTNGVGIHHAGFMRDYRRLIETNFRKGTLKALVSTTTLAAGVNTPARRVIVETLYRWNSNLRTQELIPRWEANNAFGRAGRPQYDPYGEAIVISTRKQYRSVKEYLQLPVEPVQSQLLEPKQFSSHVLSEIWLNESCSFETLQLLFNSTFLAHEGGTELIKTHLQSMLEFLFQYQLINRSVANGETYYNCTTLGSTFVRLYISPMSAPVMLAGILEMDKGKKLTNAGLLEYITSFEDWEVTRARDAEAESWASLHRSEFIVPSSLVNGDRYTDACKDAHLLLEYIDETEDSILKRQFFVSGGDLFVAKQNADWLIYATRSIYTLLIRQGVVKNNVPLATLSVLHKRIQKGVKEELLDLCGVKGIGRKRARTLFNKGIKTAKDLNDQQSVGQLENDGSETGQLTLD